MGTQRELSTVKPVPRSTEGSTSPARYMALWVALCIAPLLLQTVLLSDMFTPDSRAFESPMTLFLLVVIAASLCVITSTFVLLRAIVTSTPELAPVGLFFFGVSILPLAHGILTPGVWYTDNPATMATALWAIPVGLIFAAPNLLPTPLRRRFLPHHWRNWIALGVVIMTGIFVASIAIPHRSPTFLPGGTLEKVVAVISIVGTLALSYRQVRLAQIARSLGPLAIAVGYAFVASSAVLWFGTTPYSVGFWSAHLLDICGVLAGTIGILVVYRKADDVSSALSPILTSDPLAALELGLEPVVHEYVADLEAKDPITRDHVVRTAELALQVGQELGFDGDELRHISLVGLLHDVGKLDVPDEILNKPGRLTDDDFEIIKRHPITGSARTFESPILAPLTPGIRGHHERIDGCGYPDGLAGDDIPVSSRIVAVCDAYDAMASTRQYRQGMGHEKAIAILREHSGSQWDASVVEALVRVLHHRHADTSAPALDRVGRDPKVVSDQRVGCDCLPRELLEPASR